MRDYKLYWARNDQESRVGNSVCMACAPGLVGALRSEVCGGDEVRYIITYVFQLLNSNTLRANGRVYRNKCGSQCAPLFYPRAVLPIHTTFIEVILYFMHRVAF